MLRYKEYSAERFEIVSKDEDIVATVECDGDGKWHIRPKSGWAPRNGTSFGPFATAEAAFSEIGAVVADQS